MQSLGRNHAFETAIADVVDNSVDAGAQNTLIRFVRDGDRLIGLLVVDDGHGMNEKQLDVAMTIGGRRKYGPRDLGRFGLGLKAASFGQARSLTVVSRAARSAAVGRRWQLGRAKNQFLCDVVDRDFAERLLGRDWDLPRSRTGTVVRWDEVGGFPSVSDQAVVDRFLTSTITKLRQHLGLVYHRLLGHGLTHIYVDVEDVESGGVALRYEIEPLDPFNYLRPGRPGYPVTLAARANGHELALHRLLNGTRAGTAVSSSAPPLLSGARNPKREGVNETGSTPIADLGQRWLPPEVFGRTSAGSSPASSIRSGLETAFSLARL